MVKCTITSRHFGTLYTNKKIFCIFATKLIEIINYGKEMYMLFKSIILQTGS